MERRPSDRTVVVRLDSSISGIADDDPAAHTVQPVAYPVGTGDGFRPVDF